MTVPERLLVVVLAAIATAAVPDPVPDVPPENVNQLVPLLDDQEHPGAADTDTVSALETLGAVLV